jgi:toxin ParE1/3/4
MSLPIQKADFFKQDYAIRFAWYVDEAGPDVARRFQATLDQSLNKLASHPDLGRIRHFRNPRLQGLRSLPVERPFNKVLVFYHASSDVPHAVALIHGARDLPRRLLESPDSGSD